MNGGYIYLMAFDNGIVKVGCARCAKNIGRRLKTHAVGAHNFGITVIEKWVSPPHAGWAGNEDALIQAAHDLGGKPMTREYFKGVSFEALLEKARQLPFTSDPVPRRLPLDALAIRQGRIRNWMTQAEVAERVTNLGVEFDRSTLSNIENGKTRYPAVKVIPALAQVLGLEVAEMFKAGEAA